jgi:hypothetical protein
MTRRWTRVGLLVAAIVMTRTAMAAADASRPFRAKGALGFIRC